MIAEAVFWCSVILVFYAYLGYACALRLLALFRHRPVSRADIRPAVSFIIAAHNEERRIAGKIENTLHQQYAAGTFEIIVASDASTDSTDDIVRSYAPRVRLVRAGERRGKEAAQQLAVQAASGDILVFSDVATALAPDAVATIVKNFADPNVGCVSSTDRFVDEQGTVSGEGAYVRYEMWLRALESRVNTLVGLSGSFFAARREVCHRWVADGRRDFTQSDFSMLLHAVEMGLRGILDTASVGYYRNIVDERREFQRKIRTVIRAFPVLTSNLRLLNPLEHGLFAWQLASHKLCRWLVPFAMIAAATSNAFLLWRSELYGVTFLLQVGLYTAALAGVWIRSPLLKIPMFLVLANAAVLTAWLRFARGDRIVSWNPSDRINALPHVESH